MALRHARDVYTRRNEGVSIWVVPRRRHHRLEPRREGPAVRAERRQGLPAPDVLRHPRQRPPHVMADEHIRTSTRATSTAASTTACSAATPRTGPSAPTSRTRSPASTRRSPTASTPPSLAAYCLMLGDDALVCSHRLSEWCSHAPDLEEDIALANIALDLLGQARLLLARAAAADPSRRAGAARGLAGAARGRAGVLPRRPASSATCGSSSSTTATSR